MNTQNRDLGTGDLCDNIGLSAQWSYVTAPPDKAIPILSPLFFMHVGHPLLKIPFLVLFRQVATRVYLLS